MYLFWSIFRFPAKKSQAISHLMIILASPMFFRLNFFISWFFSYFNLLVLFDLKTRLFIYTLMIIIISFPIVIRIYVSVLVRVKRILLKNLISVLFQSFVASFNQYSSLIFYKQVLLYQLNIFMRFLYRLAIYSDLLYYLDMLQ